MSDDEEFENEEFEKKNNEIYQNPETLTIGNVFTVKDNKHQFAIVSFCENKVTIHAACNGLADAKKIIQKTLRPLHEQISFYVVQTNYVIQNMSKI